MKQTFLEFIAEKFGEILRESGLKQREFGVKYGISESQISSLKNAKERGAGEKLALTLASKLHLPPDTFFPPEERRRYFALPPESMRDDEKRLTRLPILGYASVGGRVDPGDIRVVRYLALPEGLPGDIRGIEVSAGYLNYGDRYDLRMEDLLIIGPGAVNNGDLAVVSDGGHLWLRRVWETSATGPDGKPHKFTKRSAEGIVLTLIRKYR